MTIVNVPIEWIAGRAFKLCPDTEDAGLTCVDGCRSCMRWRWFGRKTRSRTLTGEPYDTGGTEIEGEAIDLNGIKMEYVRCVQEEKAGGDASK